MAGEGEGRQFLPPEPSGDEPDLGEAPTREVDSSEAGPQSAADGGYAPPSGAQPGPGSPPPPPSTPQSPAQWQGQPQQPWTYAPRPIEPDNGPAVAGFILSLVGGGLLLISFGLSSIVSLICSGLGVFYSKRGRERVDRGETPKHRGLAQAGFIIGLISLVLSVLATLGYAALVVLYFTNDEFRDQFDREFQREIDSQNAAINVAVIALRLARGGLSLIT